MKVITIGRTQDNDIVVNDVKVSRNHLQIVQDDYGNYSVVDLDSTNGTFINGQRVTGEVLLQSNDVVQIGNTQLPWQNYLSATSSTNQPIHKDSTKLKLKLKSKSIIWYIPIAAFTVLLLIGCVYLYVNHKNRKELEKQEQIQTAKENELKEQYQQKLSEAEKYKKQASDLYQQAIKTGDESYRKLADEKQKLSERASTEASSLNNRIEQLQKQLTKAQQEQQAAEQKALDAENAKKDAESRARNAETEKDNAENHRKLAENKEKILSDKIIKDSIKIEELKTLTKIRAINGETFYSKIANFNEDDCKSICEDLGYGTANAKNEIIQKFRETEDINEIQRIIKAVNNYSKTKE